MVIDACAIVEALLGTGIGVAVRTRIRGHRLHAPAHVDAEVLSALGRLHRAGELPAAAIAVSLRELATTPIRRHPLAPLLAGAWGLRDQVRLVDALYLELASALGSIPLLTADARLACAAQLAELVGGPDSH